MDARNVNHYQIWEFIYTNNSISFYQFRGLNNTFTGKKLSKYYGGYNNVTKWSTNYDVDDFTYKFAVIIEKAHSFCYTVKAPSIIFIPVAKKR